jgi:predicted RNase H-like nuclease
VVVVIDDDAAEPVTVAPEPSLLTAWHEHEADRWLLDVPLNLDTDTRKDCDAAARDRAGERASSVFPAPTPDQVANRSEAENIGSQTRWLTPQIREWQALRATVDEVTSAVLESHPEVCYARFAEREDVASKHTDDGVAERLSILASVDGAFGEVVQTAVAACREASWRRRLRSGAVGDVLDAAVLALTAHELSTRGLLDDPPVLPAGADPSREPAMVVPPSGPRA